jgi:Methyltransferase domain
MDQGTRGPSRQPTLTSSPVDPPRIATDSAPAVGAAFEDDVNACERRVAFENGSGVELQYPARLVWPSPWIGHIPFAFRLVEALRPRVVVELGVHSGNSYCAFLQAVQSLALPAQCYGIDHWRGDEHSDHYGDDVYADLCAYHDPLYGTFSTLIRATFEEALPYFPDQSVDLLHIDGFHTYEAVAKDFSDWLPKVSARGVVLFHDINVREREFGVCRFWQEVAARYQTFAFVHSHGLGLAYVGTEPPPAALRTLLAPADPDSVSRTRAYFARLGTSLVDRFARRQAEGVAGRVRASEAGLEAAMADLKAARADLEAARSGLEGARAGLEAARAEISRQGETVDALRAEVGAANAQTVTLQNELTGAKAAIARQIEGASRLEQELAASRAEAARQVEAAGALQQESSTARSEVARLTDVASHRETEAQQAADRSARLEDELIAARAEIARQLQSADASRASAERMAGQAAAGGEELVRARGQTSEAIAQRERATRLLRQQITTTAGLQRELAASRSELARQLEAANASRATAEKMAEQITALGEELVRARGDASEAIARWETATQHLQQQVTASAGLQRELADLRQTEAIAALVNRLATVKHTIPGPIRRYIKNRLLGVRPRPQTPHGS